VTEILLSAVVILLVASLYVLVIVLRKVSQADATGLASRLDGFEKGQDRIERTVREEVAESREELGKAAREQRQELVLSLKTFGESFVQRMTELAGVQKGQLDAFSSQLGSFAKASGERLDAARAESVTAGKHLREEVVATLKSISETMTKTMTDVSLMQKGQLDVFSAQLESFAKSSAERFDAARAENATAGKHLREEVVATLKSICRGDIEEHFGDNDQDDGRCVPDTEGAAGCFFFSAWVVCRIQR